MKVDKIKSELVKYGKKVVANSFVIGSGGNISAREENILYISARGVFLGEAKRKDFVAVDLKTSKVLNKKLKPSFEIKMHLSCFRARPDIKAVIHVHPPLTVAISQKINILKAKDYEIFAASHRNIPVIKFFPAGSIQLAKAVAKAIKDYDAVILRNHGLVTVGKSLKDAFIKAQAIERAAGIFIVRKLISG